MKNVGLGLALITLAGCASIIGENVNTDVPFAGGGSRTFTFKKSVGASAVTKDQIYGAFVDAFRSASLVKPEFVTYSDSGDKYTRGLHVEKDSAGNIQVDHLDNYASLIESRRATYVLEIAEAADVYQVKMTCPKSYHDIGTLRGGALPGRQPYVTAEQAVRNFVTLCEKATPAIQSVEYVKGEIDSKFPSESVFANFSRLLRQQAGLKQEEMKAFDIEKAEVFVLSTPQLDTTLALSVFPYRGGAKAIYSIKYPYTVRADGTSSYDTGVIALAKKRIEAVAND